MGHRGYFFLLFFAGGFLPAAGLEACFGAAAFFGFEGFAGAGLPAAFTATGFAAGAFAGGAAFAAGEGADFPGFPSGLADAAAGTAAA